MFSSDILDNFEYGILCPGLDGVYILLFPSEKLVAVKTELKNSIVNYFCLSFYKQIIETINNGVELMNKMDPKDCR